MNKIPGYKSIREFERQHELPEGTGKRHMQRGYCAWPRKTVLDGCRSHFMYKHWRSIVDRCTTKGHSAYKNYGGRGIKVCAAWRLDFWQFVKDVESLGPKPTPQHTLDRINNDGHYELRNVRWASKSDQNMNQRLHTDNTSGRRGLSYHTRDGLWAVSRQYKGINHRKQFRTREEAEQYLDQLERGNP